MQVSCSAQEKFAAQLRAPKVGPLRVGGGGGGKVGEEEEGGTMLGFVQAAFAQEHPAWCPIKEGRWYAQLVPATVAALLGSSTTRAVTVGMYKQLLKACGVQADHPNFGVQHVVLRQGGAKGKKDDGDDAVCGECRRATLPDSTEVDSFVFHPEVLAAGGLPAAGHVQESPSAVVTVRAPGAEHAWVALLGLCQDPAQPPVVPQPRKKAVAGEGADKDKDKAKAKPPADRPKNMYGFGTLITVVAGDVFANTVTAVAATLTPTPPLLRLPPGATVVVHALTHVFHRMVMDVTHAKTFGLVGDEEPKCAQVLLQAIHDASTGRVAFHKRLRAAKAAAKSADPDAKKSAGATKKRGKPAEDEAGHEDAAREGERGAGGQRPRRDAAVSFDLNEVLREMPVVHLSLLWLALNPGKTSVPGDPEELTHCIREQLQMAGTLMRDMEILKIPFTSLQTYVGSLKGEVGKMSEDLDKLTKELRTARHIVDFRNGKAAAGQQVVVQPETTAYVKTQDALDDYYRGLTRRDSGGSSFTDSSSGSDSSGSSSSSSSDDGAEVSQARTAPSTSSKGPARNTAPKAAAAGKAATATPKKTSKAAPSSGAAKSTGVPADKGKKAPAAKIGGVAVKDVGPRSGSRVHMPTGAPQKKQRIEAATH